MSIYIRKDHWTPTEDKIVRAAVMKYGTNQWSRVASLLVRKSAAQCKARWHEHLSPQLSHNAWTAQEDAKLLDLEKAMPNMWRSIGATLGGRTAAQCLERWTYLNDARNLDTAQELLADAEIAESEDSEPNSDSERQMMAEAKARLSNNLGKKANRKQRERLDDEEAFARSIMSHRATGSAIKLKQSKFGIDYSQGIPYETVPDVAEPGRVGPSRRTQRSQLAHAPKTAPRQRPPRLPRHRLALPPPVSTPAPVSPAAPMADQLAAREKLENLPASSTRNTLLTLAVASLGGDDMDHAQNDADNDKPGSDEDEQLVSSSISIEDVLRDSEPRLSISARARRLLEQEVARLPHTHRNGTVHVPELRAPESLSNLQRKYDLLQQRLLEAQTRVRRTPPVNL